MLFKIQLTHDAFSDLIEIYDYVFRSDDVKKAEYVLSKIESRIRKLDTLPERGAKVPELAELGIKEYREVFFKPYRIIYRIIDDTVFIYFIVDGRRDMQSLLERRLFNP